MSYGWGSGQKEFIGYGSTIDCSHCNNRGVEHVYATYSYEEFLLIRFKYMGGRGSTRGDGEIIFMCRICNYGFTVTGLELSSVSKKALAKGPGGAAAAAQFAVSAENELAAAQDRFNMEHTRAWVEKLNPLKRLSYFKLLRRLGLFDLCSRLGG